MVVIRLEAPPRTYRTELGKRVCSEHCDRLRVSLLRRSVAVSDTSAILPDGSQVALAWVERGGCFGAVDPATGKQRRTTRHSIRALCAACDALSTVLWRCPGSSEWLCDQCARIIHPSQLRSGGRRGGAKPISTQVARIAAKQVKAAEQLGLPMWPPQKLFWSRCDLTPTRPIHHQRRNALLDRLTALELLRVLLLEEEMRRICKAGAPPPDPKADATSRKAAEKLVKATEWATKETWQFNRSANPIRPGRPPA